MVNDYRTLLQELTNSVLGTAKRNRLDILKDIHTVAPSQRPYPWLTEWDAVDFHSRFETDRRQYIRDGLLIPTAEDKRWLEAEAEGRAHGERENEKVMQRIRESERPAKQRGLALPGTP